MSIGWRAAVRGCAKLPCLTDEHESALRNQLEQFELADKDFPVMFERRVIEVPYRDSAVELPLHVYSTDGDYAADVC